MNKERKIVEIRVFELLPKQHDWTVNSPRLGHAFAESARQLLGTVSVRDDGSAYFRVPANKPVYFQAVDAEGKAVQTMRSDVYLQPGERRSCVGCHEPPHAAPESFISAGKPLDLIAGSNGTKPLSYAQLVQRILERHCVACHNEKMSSSKIDLRGMLDGDFFVSYNNLRSYIRWYEWGGNSIQQTTTLPERCGADESPLTTILADKNHGDKIGLTNDDLRKIYLWLDANIPFYSTFTKEERLQQLK